MIAGMGGPLIVSILEDGRDLVNSLPSQLVLQPNVAAVEVRQWLLTITGSLYECIIEEDNHYYEILTAQKGDPEKPYRQAAISRERPCCSVHFFLLKKNQLYKPVEKGTGKLGIHQQTGRQGRKQRRSQKKKSSCSKSRSGTGRYFHERRGKGQTVIDVFEEWSPRTYAVEGDRVGLMVGMLDKPVSRVLVALDVTDEVIEEAISAGAELIIAHHPLIFRPLTEIDTAHGQGPLIEKVH